MLFSPGLCVSALKQLSPDYQYVLLGLLRLFPYLLLQICSYFIRIKSILPIFTPQNNIKNKIFYSQKQTRKLCIVFFTITICKKRQKHSINSPRNSPHKATMVIIGNYSRKMRFSDTKSSKRATPTLLHATTIFEAQISAFAALSV